MFVEFPGAMGGLVLISADAIATISVGSPRKMNSGAFFDPIRVYYRPGYEACEDKFNEFWIDDDYVAVWLEAARKTLYIERPTKGED